MLLELETFQFFDAADLCFTVTKKTGLSSDYLMNIKLLFLLFCKLCVAFPKNSMDSNGITSPYKDKWDADGGCQSTTKDSPESLRRQEDENDDDSAEKNATWRSDSEQDQLSDVDGRRSSPSFYSDEYDSPSEGSKLPYSQSRISSHSPQRRKQAKTTSSTPISKAGACGLVEKKCDLRKCPGDGSVVI